MQKRTMIDRQAAAFAQKAQRQLAELNKALSALNDKASGLQRSIQTPNLKTTPGSRYSKRTTDTSTLGNVLTMVAGNLINYENGDKVSLSLSSSQKASLIVKSIGRAQRIL